MLSSFLVWPSYVHGKKVQKFDNSEVSELLRWTVWSILPGKDPQISVSGKLSKNSCERQEEMCLFSTLVFTLSLIVPNVILLNIC